MYTEKNIDLIRENCKMNTVNMTNLQRLKVCEFEEGDLSAKNCVEERENKRVTKSYGEECGH